jgi:hypothetical protein
LIVELSAAALFSCDASSGVKILGGVVTHKGKYCMYPVQLWVCIKFGPLKCKIDEKVSGEKISVKNYSSASVCLFVDNILLAR